METSQNITVFKPLRKNISHMSLDLLNLFIEFLEKCENNIGSYGLGLISSENACNIMNYRLVNKSFSSLILQNLKRVKISSSSQAMGVLLRLPFALRRFDIIIRQGFDDTDLYRLISQCKELNQLTFHVLGNKSLNVLGLQLIGENCTKLQEFELHMNNHIQDSVSDFLSSFSNVSKLSLRPLESCGHIAILPPQVMPIHQWHNLTSIGGNLISHPSWRKELAKLPSLQSITWNCSISDFDVSEFCDVCKGLSICQTLESLDFIAEFQPNAANYEREAMCLLTDVGLCSVLDTFEHLKHLNLHYTNVSLTAAGAVISIYLYKFISFIILII
jgi:hypothetical protein